MKISEEIKDRIDKLSYDQKLEVECDLNCWKWNPLLGDKPHNFDLLQNYNDKNIFYKLLSKNKTRYKYDYTHPIRKYLDKFIDEKDSLHYWNVIKRKSMTEMEFELFWINLRIDKLEGNILLRR